MSELIYLQRQCKQITHKHKTKDLYIHDTGPMGIAFRNTKTGGMQCTGRSLELFLKGLDLEAKDFVPFNGQTDYEQGDLIAVTIGLGENIQLLRYHSDYTKDAFSAYLHFDMRSEHSTIYQLDDIIPLKEVMAHITKHLTKDS